MIKAIRDTVGYYVCETAFCFDRVFMKNLEPDESKWSLSDKVKYSIFKFIYNLGTRIYS